MAKRVPPLSSAQVANLKPDPAKVVELGRWCIAGPATARDASRDEKLVAEYPLRWRNAAF